MKAPGTGYVAARFWKSSFRLANHALAFAMGCVLGICSARGADSSVGEFYQNKTISIIVAGGPEGAYGQYANLISRFLTKYLSGHPAVITRFMPGGGGIVAANYTYNLAPRDGTTIAALLASMPISERIGRPGIRYKSTEFAWIGRFSSANGVLTIHGNAPAITLEEMTRTPVVIAATGVEQLPILANWALGTKFKIINGYQGSQGGVLAYERGEVDGFYASWASLKISYPQHLHDLHVLQSGLEPEKGYGDVPLLVDVVKDPIKQQVCAFFAAEDTIGRFLVAPPGTPAVRVAALRKAFDDAVSDPDFLAEASRVEIEPRTGAALEKIVETLFAVPPNIVALATQATGLGGGK